MEKQKIYKRDSRSPIPEKEITSKIMSKIKGKNTKPELLLRKALWKNNIKGYRLHWKKVPGNPDIAFPGKRIAIFVNGCFWHRCPHCQLHVPKSHSEYWKEKFRRNVERDKRKIELLKAENWKVLVFWECQIKNNLDDCINKIKEIV
jgi:DNA mismatch endonuclease (patch repair protein)